MRKQQTFIRKQHLQNNLLTRNVKEFNVIFLILIGILLIGMAGGSSFALFSSETSSLDKITGTVVKKPPTGAETIIEKVGTGGLVAESHPLTQQLAATTTYMYTGADPDNYISFNDELWRIIGVFDVDDGEGNIEQRIKLIRNENIGNIVWDRDNVNNWTVSSGMELLNTGDYWNRTGSYQTTGLTEEAKNQISDAKWYLGGPIDYTLANATQFYNYERGITVYSGNPTSWVGKVGLMYPSDYGYATSGGSTTNRDACLAKEMYLWNDSSVSDCKNNDWLGDSLLSLWTITPDSDASSESFHVSSSGFVGHNPVEYALETTMSKTIKTSGSSEECKNAVGTATYVNCSSLSCDASNAGKTCRSVSGRRCYKKECMDTLKRKMKPVVYLKSDIQIIGGTGTESDPYTLPEPAIKKVISKVGTDGLVADSHSATTQLQATTAYRYTGANPNNYVSFNNELWRIIGVFDVDNGTGNLEQRVKIIRNNSIGMLSWDYESAEDYANNWKYATGMKLLNTGDYWNRTGDYTSTGLTPGAKKMIADAKWYLGGTASYTSSSDGLASHFYGYERGSTVYTGNSKSWVGKVALMYPSDYGYATSGGTTTNREACLAKEIYNWDDSSVSDCKNNDWLYKSSNRWTLTHDTDDSKGVLYVHSSGIVKGDSFAYNRFQFLPCVYLKSDIKIIGGTGTESDPYQLSI